MRRLLAFHIQFFALCLCTQLAVPVLANATVLAPEAPPHTWRRGSWGVSATSEYFSSSANYTDRRGEFERLPGSNSYSSLESTLRGRYAFTPELSVYSGIGGGYAAISTAAADKTNLQVDRAFFGADYLLFKKWLRVIPEIEGAFPLTSYTVGSTTPMIGNGTSYLRAGVFLIKPLGRFVLHGYIGAQVPDQSFSKQFLYQSGLEYRFTRELSVGAGADGYETLMGDTAKDTDRLRTSLSANAGSFRHWAYDPALFQAKAWLGYRPVAGASIRIGYGKTITGIRSGEGQSFLLAVAFNSAGNTKWDEAPVKPERAVIKKIDPALRDFKEEVQPAEKAPFEADDKAEENTNGKTGTE